MGARGVRNASVGVRVPMGPSFDEGERFMGAHLIDGEFQSDKYPETPRGCVPLKPSDPTAQDLLWEYAQRRRAVDPEFADDLEEALRLKGYKHQL